MSAASALDNVDVRILLLGTFEVRVDGRPVGPAGARRRGLLAVLALEAGRVLSSETIIDRLWGDDPPASAGSLVHTYVSTWRTFLGGRDGPLRTAGAGYSLVLAEEQCDLSRFRTLVRSARGAEPRQAERALSEALSLWRGPVLADLAGEPLHDRVATALEGERVRAVEAWAEAALRIGGDADAVLERLAELAESHPLRENLAALIMWAQTAAGSASDALRTYDEARRTLRDELGMDPSPVLRDMHGRVLRADPSLVRAPATPDPPVTTIGTTDPLFGRDRDLVEVGALAHERRLVTLTGPGGAGKTRLAVELLQRHVAGGNTGWFVDLAAVRDEALMTSTVAAAVGAPSAAGSDPEAALKARLSTVDAMLVLDNVEHLRPVADLVAWLRRSCPGLRLIVTSRSGLGIAGERQYPVPLLDVPDASLARDGGARAVEAVDGVRLLVDRATAADPSFRVTDGNAQDVAELVRRLDGLPLALEITAPWLRILTPAELVARVSTSALDLTTHRRDLPERQRTLRHTIAWSYDLLSPRERRVFRRLAVFVGSFSLPAVEAVCADDAVDALEVAEHLLSLVDHHLVRRSDAAAAGPRFRLLETVREFASERLAEDPDRDEVRDRHLRFLVGWASELAAHSEGPESGQWLALAVAESDNLRWALDQLRERGDHERALQLTVDAMVVWFEAGHEDEGERRLRAALDAAGPRSPARAIGLTYWAWLRATRDRSGAAAAAQEALALARSEGDPLVEAFAQQTLGDTLDDGDAALAASSAVFEAAERSVGRPVRYGPTAPDAVRCGASASIATAWMHRSLDDALVWQRDALRLAEVEGDRRITAVNAARLAGLHLLSGDVRTATELVERARSLVSTHVTARWEDIVAFAEAGVAFHAGRLDEAESRLERLVTSAASGGRPMHARLGSLLLADLLTHLGRADEAARLLDRLTRVPGVLDEPVAAVAAEARWARLDRLAGRTGSATTRLDAIENVLPADQLPPERVMLLVERALLADSAPDRHRRLALLTEAQARTGVRLPPWELALLP